MVLLRLHTLPKGIGINELTVPFQIRRIDKGPCLSGKAHHGFFRLKVGSHNTAAVDDADGPVFEIQNAHHIIKPVDRLHGQHQISPVLHVFGHGHIL